MGGAVLIPGFAFSGVSPLLRRLIPRSLTSPRLHPPPLDLLGLLDLPLSGRHFVFIKWVERVCKHNFAHFGCSLRLEGQGRTLESTLPSYYKESKPMHYSSRSATECYFDCPYKRYLRYHYLGYGITPILRNVPLTTGSAVHTGVEIILKAIKKGLFTEGGDNSRVTEFAVGKAALAYRDIVGEAGFKLNEGFDDGGYLYQEQLALTEGLVRAYAIIEAPYIIREYNILSVEKDIPLQLAPYLDLDYPARADAILQHKVDSRIYVYSLKTTKMWNERTQNSYRIDLQGVTELAAVRQLLHNTKFESMLGGVAYCFLVKGNFAQRENGAWETDSPLIRGWRYATPTGMEYAHSFWFPNPYNASGKGRLGNGWSPFKVWSDYEGGVKAWVGDIANGVIQPDVPNPLIECVRSPLPSYRDDNDLDRTLSEILGIERRVMIGVQEIGKATNRGLKKDAITTYFPRNRRSCWWPTQCEFIPVCHSGVTKPLESGYQLRTPHHEAERNEFIKIQGVKK
jgi:hypothetical protein